MLAWRADGSPGSPAVVLLHGLGESMHCWDRVAPLLADRFRVVLVDLPGFGDSPGGGRGTTIEDFAHTVAEVLRPADVADAVVAGHSMGGEVAVALAEQEPALVERVVLVNTPPTVESRLTAHKGSERIVRLPVIGPLLWRILPEDRMRDGLRSAFAPGFDVPDQFVADMCGTSWDGFVGGTTAVDAYLAERPLGERVATLNVPVTVIFGEQDRRVDVASLSVYDRADNATVVRLPEVGHTPVWEAPERTAELIAGPAAD
jgi:pimeloyl-ACP methyl ester carboxylesterase